MCIRDRYYGGQSEFFDYDKVVIATHADEALEIIDNPTEDEKKILFYHSMSQVQINLSTMKKLYI